MANYAVMPVADYADACDAVREKTGGTAAIKSGEMADLIRSIPKPNVKVIEFTLAAETTSVLTAVKGDPDVIAHRLEENFLIIVQYLGDFETTESCQTLAMVGNQFTTDTYGTGIYKAAGATASSMYKPKYSVGGVGSGMAIIVTTAAGNIVLYNNPYKRAAGTYRIIVSW